MIKIFENFTADHCNIPKMKVIHFHVYIDTLIIIEFG